MTLLLCMRVFVDCSICTPILCARASAHCSFVRTCDRDRQLCENGERERPTGREEIDCLAIRMAISPYFFLSGLHSRPITIQATFFSLHSVSLLRVFAIAVQCITTTTRIGWRIEREIRGIHMIKSTFEQICFVSFVCWRLLAAVAECSIRIHGQAS